MDSLKAIRDHKLNTSQIAILALLGLIAAGTFLLSLPVSHAPQAEVTLFDALFTSTSALCVTGLTVVDTGSAFSGFGTAVILVLFQIGGLGMLLWSSTMIVLLGGRLGLRHRLQAELGCTREARRDRCLLDAARLERLERTDVRVRRQDVFDAARAAATRAQALGPVVEGAPRHEPEQQLAARLQPASHRGERRGARVRR